ncbi:MAG: acyl-CoA thioesterase/bile acid-CoA:amino acid N-acyltransferase family protein [Henriciella sp.]|nr:acyl-CoA thioesterase/bile acid-CoA:amino acid N-acyltransferase family protein [Henriciella sp.]
MPTHRQIAIGDDAVISFNTKWCLGLLSVCVLTACDTPDPVLNTPQGPILQGEPVEISLQHLEPGQSVELTVEEVRLRRGVPAFYTSSATFEADASGAIDTASMAPISGSYSGIDQAGLFWSRSRPDDQQPAEDAELVPLTVSADLNGDGIADLSSTVSWVDSYPGTELKTLGEAYPGAVFATPLDGEGPWPVLFILGGSEGHDTTARKMAPVFASHGYFAVGLPYYSPAWGDQPQRVPGLPRAFANIDVAILEDIIGTIADFPQANTDKIGLWGVSKGAEYALIAGTKIPDIDAIAAIVPSDIVWEGWGAGETVSSFAWKGEPLDFVPYKGMDEEFQKETPVLRIPHDAGRAAFPDRVEAARIPVTSIDEPLFLVGGDEDKVWASGPMARLIKTARDAAGLETELYVSETAGHYLSGHGYQPANEADAKVKTVAWPAMLAFLERELKSD